MKTVIVDEDLDYDYQAILRSMPRGYTDRDIIKALQDRKIPCKVTRDEIRIGADECPYSRVVANMSLSELRRLSVAVDAEIQERQRDELIWSL